MGWLLVACEPAPAPAPVPATESDGAPASAADPCVVRLMTFNIRYGTADDGEHHWTRRREHALEVISEWAPDILAVQEALDFQVDAIRERLPWLQVVGEHRDGGRGGEFSGLLVDTRRLEIVRTGHFWLSETPQAPRSRSWDTALHRTASWAEVEVRGAPDRRMVVLGTHFDHRGAMAREHSAKLIVSSLELEGSANGWVLPCIVMGDFNAGESSAPMEVFRGAGFLDTFRVLHGADSGDAGPTGTFHAFRGTTDGDKIDGIWLLAVSGEPRVVQAEILRPRRDGRPASDHDPVVAVVEW